MGEALVHKGTKLAEAIATDTAQGEIKMIEGQLAKLKHNYEGWISMVAQAALPEQYLMMESDLQAALEVMDLVQE